MVKTINLILTLNLIITTCVGQSADTLIRFANVNEGLFWEILSKNYPFSHQDIERYKEDINFVFLSSNENIDWTQELIKKYESSLCTSRLQRNKSVPWKESFIKEFLNREWLDWSEL